uniref:50S ribosomal protein L9, chloroplastic n=1 Tax=Polysiphonia urceolata TaxID=173545 RepID=A0A1Z1MCK1_POLUR|nr:ribosomal protein L9 [Polysiphonia stricta]ARW63602.1 ribosomal protein L9 [Polysiphonia stricta]
MKKKINLIVTKDNLHNLTKGSLINVSRGYAFNYLIPNQIAEIASQGKIKHIQMFQEINKKKKEERNINEALLEKNIKKIKKISIYKKKGENNLIFGSVTEKDIIKWITKYTNLKINKTQIKIIEAKSIGTSYIEINVNTKINTQIALELIPMNI